MAYKAFYLREMTEFKPLLRLFYDHVNEDVSQEVEEVIIYNGKTKVTKFIVRIFQRDHGGLGYELQIGVSRSEEYRSIDAVLAALIGAVA